MCYNKKPGNLNIFCQFVWKMSQRDNREETKSVRPKGKDGQCPVQTVALDSYTTWIGIFIAKRK
jgi:hypothetical protein